MCIRDRVKTAGIPTVLINREPTEGEMAVYDKIAYVGCDAAQSGTYQGELILETENKGDINGDGVVSYIMIQGDPENVDAQLRTEYSVKALEDAGVKVEQLDMQRGDWDQNKGQEICATDPVSYTHLARPQAGKRRRQKAGRVCERDLRGDRSPRELSARAARRRGCCPIKKNRFCR